MMVGINQLIATLEKFNYAHPSMPYEKRINDDDGDDGDGLVPWLTEDLLSSQNLLTRL